MTLTDFIVQTRLLGGDGPADNLTRLENLDNREIGNVLDGHNTVFVVMNIPMTSLLAVYADGTALDPTNPQQVVSVDLPSGTITLYSAPTSTLKATYYYNLFGDDTWEEFVRQGIERCNLTSQLDDPTTDVPNLPNGLLAALREYTLYGYCMRVAQQTGLWYNQRLQERVEDRDSISTKWAKLAKQHLDDGDATRNDYYGGAGTQHKPSFRITQHVPRTYTPPR